MSAAPLARAPRPGDRAKALRAALAAQIQALVDVYNARRRAEEAEAEAEEAAAGGATAAAAAAAAAPPPPPPAAATAPPSSELGELRSPGLLSLDMGAAMLLGRGRAGPDRLQPCAVYLTLLGAAALAGHGALVRRALAARCGCAPDEASRSGVSPLLAACMGGHAAVVEALLDYADEDGGDGRGGGGFGGGGGGGGAARAAGPRSAELVNVALPGGACGRTAVEACALGGAAAADAVLPLLLRRGLRVNAVDAFGRAPLRILLQYGAWRGAALLCRHGARFTRDDLDALPKTAEGARPSDAAAVEEILLHARAAAAEMRGAGVGAGAGAGSAAAMSTAGAGGGTGTGASAARYGGGGARGGHR